MALFNLIGSTGFWCWRRTSPEGSSGEGEAPIQLIVNGVDANSARLLEGYVQGVWANWLQGQLAAQGTTFTNPVAAEPRVWFNYSGDHPAAHPIAGVRLLVTPLRPLEILIGKAMPGFVIGVFEASLVVVLALYWFGVPLQGELWVLYLGIGLFVLAAVGVGLAISSLALTLQQALLGAFLFLVPAVVLFGFATPIANMTPVVQALTLVDPLRYYLVILRGVFLEGAGFHLLWGQMWPLALIALATLGAAG